MSFRTAAKYDGDANSIWPEWKNHPEERFYWQRHLENDLKGRTPRQLDVQGRVGVVKGVEMPSYRGDARPRDLTLYIPTGPETAWALEHLPKNYSDDPRYPITPENFERKWAQEHSKPGHLRQTGDELELAFGMHRLRESDPLDITDGLLCHAAGYNGTYHGRKIGPYFHRTCVSPRVRLPEGAGPREWLQENLRVAFGLGLAASEKHQDLHLYYLYHAYAPMAGKVMNRVPNDHDQTRNYTVTKKQQGLLNALRLKSGPAADCPEVVYFVMESSTDLHQRHFTYDGIDDHLRHWPYYFNNGLLPQRQVALFKHLAKKRRPNPLEDCMKVCETLYGAKHRPLEFKEDCDLVQLVGDEDIEERLDWVQKKGSSLYGNQGAAPEFSKLLMEGTRLDKDRADWLAGVVIDRTKRLERAKRVIQTAIEIFAGLEGDDLWKKTRNFADYFMNYDTTDHIVGMLEAETDTDFVFPGIDRNKKSGEKGTALTLAGQTFLPQYVQSKDGWSGAVLALTLAPGEGVAARPSTEVFDLYNELYWAGRCSGYSERTPIETLYFTHLAPHLPNPFRPTKAALEALKGCYFLDLPSRAVETDVCMLDSRWTDSVFGYTYSRDDERKKREGLQARAFTVLGHMMDFARLDVLTEEEAAALMGVILHKPWHLEHGLEGWTLEAARRHVIEHYHCQELTPSHVDQIIERELAKRLTLAKLHHFECQLPAFNNLMILAHRGLIPMDKAKAIILAAVEKMKVDFVPRTWRDRLDAHTVFQRLKDIEPGDFDCLAALNIDWDILLEDWQTLAAAVSAIRKWKHSVVYADSQCDIEGIKKAYEAVPACVKVTGVAEHIRSVENKKWQRDFKQALGEAEYEGITALYAAKPEEIQLTEQEMEIYNFLQWVEQNYGWVHTTNRAFEFHTLLLSVVRRIKNGEHVSYGEVQRRISGSEEAPELVAQTIGAITDATNRGILAQYLMPTEGTTRSYAPILAAARRLDDAEMEAFLIEAPTAGAALVPLHPADATVNPIRYRRSAPVLRSNDALNKVNRAIWAASQTALGADHFDWGDTDLVLGAVASLKDRILSARMRSFGLPPIGSKIHFTQNLDDEIVRRLLSIGGLREPGFKTDGNRALVLPALPSGDELELFLSALVTVGDFKVAKPQLQLCMGTRLPKIDTAILGSSVILSSIENRIYEPNHFKTNQDGLTAGRIMVYDDHGALSPLPFARRHSLDTNGRTDMLARYARRDPWHFQLVGGVLADGVIGGEIFSDFADPWKKRYKEILGDHGLNDVLDDTWVFEARKDEDSAEARTQHHRNVMACVDAFINNLTRYNETGLADGPVIDVRNHINDLEGQIRPIQEEMLHSATYCKEREELLEF